MNRLKYTFFVIISFLFVLSLSGCGDGSSDDGGGTAATVLSGTAATGAPFVGRLNVIGSGGIQASNITIATDGRYTADVTALTPPYLLQTIPSDTTKSSLYSYAPSASVTANVTQLTTLAMFMANGNSDLATFYAAWASNTATFVQQSLLAAQAIINANLAAQFRTNGLDASTYDFFTTTFAANSSGIDAVLDATTVSLAGGSVAVSVAGSAGFTFNMAIDVSNININGGSSSKINVDVGGGLTPVYSWGGGNVRSVTVSRDNGASPSTVVWGIATAGVDGIASPVTHGTLPTGANQVTGIELALTDGVAYQVSVSRSSDGGLGWKEFIATSTTEPTYTVGGTISGATSKFVLQNSNGDTLSATGSSFTFPTALIDGANYSATVTTQPLNETCTVANGSGTINGADISDISVTCLTTGGGATYTVSGAVSGNSSALSLELQKNGQTINDLPFFAGGNFSFLNTFDSGNAYAVIITSQPSGQICTLTNGSGTITNADISNVTITCSDISNANAQSAMLRVKAPVGYYDFSTGAVLGSATNADIGGTSNEGVNFGNEHAWNTIIGRRIIRLATSGSLNAVPAVPVWSDAAPWVANSWDFTDGTGGLPLAVGEIWAVYTREGHYAVLQVTDLPGGNFGDTVTFDYLYNADGTRNF